MRLAVASVAVLAARAAAQQSGGGGDQDKVMNELSGMCFDKTACQPMATGFSECGKTTAPPEASASCMCAPSLIGAVQDCVGCVANYASSHVAASEVSVVLAAQSSVVAMLTSACAGSLTGTITLDASQISLSLVAGRPLPTDGPSDGAEQPPPLATGDDNGGSTTTTDVSAAGPSDEGTEQPPATTTSNAGQLFIVAALPLVILTLALALGP